MKESNSRIDKFEKRRKNTKLINYSFILAGVLALFLIGIWIFGGGEDKAAREEAETSPEEESFFIETEEGEESADVEPEEEVNESNEEVDESNDEEVNKEEKEDETESRVEKEEIIITEVEPSDDNVKEAITGNWPPIGTTQTGPHTTQYDPESQDWVEIKRAVSMVTEIPEDEMAVWWIGNGGDQKVIATVSDSLETETFRVYLSWIDEEGWQPTKVETLIENDKK